MQPSIGILLRELARLYTQAQREHVTSGHDTSSTQSHVLMELGRADLLTQHELGRRLSLDKGWVSRAVESLVQAGLVVKSRRDNDRRSRWLQLTPKGSVRYQALNESLDAHAEQLMQPLAAEQRASIHQALLLLLTGLQGAMPQDANHASEDDALALSDAEKEIKPLVVATTQGIELEAREEELELVGAEPESISAHPIAVASVAVEPVKVERPSAADAPTALSKTQTPHNENIGQPSAPTRILGSKTLPTRPLLSRQTPRAPLSRATPAAEVKTQVSTGNGTPVHPRVTAPRTVVPTVSTGPATPPASLPRAPVTAKPVMAPPLTARSVTVAPAKAPASPPPAVVEVRQNSSIFSKLLSQGSLFNKLLQREPIAQDETAEAEVPAEVEPTDGIQFQAASASDWNEIRNLLTANRQPIQGALNHLANFIVATDNGRVVGAIGMEVYGDIALLRSLVVASHTRGKSVGKRLIKHVIERARTKQITALYLLTGTADNLFAKFGFEKMQRADMPTKLYVSMELQGPSSTASTGMRLAL